MTGELSDVLADVVSDFDYLVFGLIFLVYIMLNSQLFADKILSNFNGALVMGHPTNQGIIIQGVIMAGLAVVIYSLYLHEII